MGFRCFLIISLFVVPSFQPSLAQTRDQQALHEFFERVWSPYCKGNSLLECPSSTAIELRRQLKQEYDAGASFEELELMLKERYGDQVHMEPPASFRGSLAYWLPWALFFAALFGLFLFWKKRTKSFLSTEDPNHAAEAESFSSSEFSSEELKKIEDEVNERL